MKVFTQKNNKITFLAVFLTSLFVLIVNLVNQLLYIEVKILLINLLKQFLKSMNTVEKQKKKHFNKNLIMTETKEGKFQSSNIYWIFERVTEDEKVRDYCRCRTY